MTGVQKTFDSPDEPLHALLQHIDEGMTQLPDFQRGWVWDDERIRGLLASVSLSYPIGAVLMLQVGGADVRFKPRLIEGVVLEQPPLPERLVLDGQQRLTSLYQALFSRRPVGTRDARGNPIKRWYYLDIVKALDPHVDRVDAIVGVPEDRVLRSFRGEVIADYSTTERECAAELLPLQHIWDTSALLSWMMTYLQVEPQRMAERLARWNRLVEEVIQRFQHYQVPLIILRKETPKDAVCQVFERVNTGAVALTVFELLTATYAIDDLRLREDWAAREKHLKHHRVLGSVESPDFLQVVTLLATWDRRRSALRAGARPEEAPPIGCKRKEILRLSVGEYRAWAEPAMTGFERAARFLQEQCIFTARDVPYRAQLLPLAAALALLGERAEREEARRKLARWFWCGVFGDLYGAGIEGRVARDLPELLAWIEENGPEPSTIAEAQFAPARLLGLRRRSGAAYKGVQALLLRAGAPDLLTGAPIDAQTYYLDRIDLRHLFPQAWCRANGVDPLRCDSVVNRTPLSAATARLIGARPPSAYLPALQKRAGLAERALDERLRSHLVDPDLLRADNFAVFFAVRTRALLAAIEQAMGKPLIYDALVPPPETPAEYEDEEGDAA